MEAYLSLHIFVSWHLKFVITKIATNAVILGKLQVLAIWNILSITSLNVSNGIKNIIDFWYCYTFKAKEGDMISKRKYAMLMDTANSLVMARGEILWNNFKGFLFKSQKCNTGYPLSIISILSSLNFCLHEIESYAPNYFIDLNFSSGKNLVSAILVSPLGMPWSIDQCHRSVRLRFWG